MVVGWCSGALNGSDTTQMRATHLKTGRNTIAGPLSNVQMWSGNSNNFSLSVPNKIISFNSH